MPTISLVLADNNPTYRDLLKEYLQAYVHFDVAATTSLGQEALELVSEVHPDLLITDLDQPFARHIASVRLMRFDTPGLRVLMLSMFDIEAFGGMAGHDDFDAYVSKADAAEKLVPAIESLFPAVCHAG